MKIEHLQVNISPHITRHSEETFLNNMMIFKIKTKNSVSSVSQLTILMAQLTINSLKNLNDCQLSFGMITRSYQVIILGFLSELTVDSAVSSAMES
jgi:hypothetical protein